MKGYSKPFSPTGKASLMLPSPHHYGGNYITVIFRADLAAIRAVIPEPLEPVENGLCFAYICDLTCVAEDPDIAGRDPAWVQYQEGVVSVECQYQGVRGRTTPYLWVNRDWSMMFGWIQGWGKKLAEVEVTRTYAHGINPGLPPVGPGTKLGGWVARHGSRVMDINIELTERAEEGTPQPTVIYAVRHFPGIGKDIPNIHQLVRNEVQGVQMQNLWNARGTLNFYDSENEELAALQPTEIVRCMSYSRGWTTSHEADLIEEYRSDPTNGAIHAADARLAH